VVRSLSAAFVALLAALWTPGLQAATVMIVRPPSPSTDVIEAVSRLNGELLSVGFAVALADRGAAVGPQGTSAPDWLDRVAGDRGIDATIDVIGEGRLEGVDVWIFRPAPRVTRVPLGPPADDAPARLAIRAIDLVRSMLIENDLGRRPAGAATPPPAAVIPSAPADSASGASAHVGIELGAALLTSLDGVGPSIQPILRLAAPIGSRLGLQGEVAGFGTRPTVGTAGSSALVAQQYLLIGACSCAPSAARLRPVLGLAVGALRTAADGQADAPLQPHAVVQWSFLAQATAGARLRLTERTHLVVAAHLQLAEPYVQIRVVNAAPATSGRPNLLLTVAVGEWL
jgi:hypothetical protein